MNTLKLLVGAWLMPLPVSLVLACCALICRRLGRRRPALVLGATAAAVCFGSAFGPVANGLLRPLEAQYPATLDASVVSPAPGYVAVLGSGYYPRAGLPVTAALDSSAMVRLAEGVRLWRQIPSATLVLSGGSIRGEPAIAEGYALAAQALGVPAAVIVRLDGPVNTAEEVQAIRHLAGNTAVVLVTSAAHMPRTMLLARSAGLRATAAPTANLTDPRARPIESFGLPSATALRKTETALHEYLGLLAIRLGVN